MATFKSYVLDILKAEDKTLDEKFIEDFAFIPESKEPFPIPLEKLVEWSVYAAKNEVRRALDNGPYKKDEDFSARLLKSTGGRPAKQIMLSVNCFRMICAQAQNEKGKLALRYLLTVETLWKRYMEAEFKRQQELTAKIERERDLARNKCHLAEAKEAHTRELHESLKMKRSRHERQKGPSFYVMSRDDKPDCLKPGFSQTPGKRENELAVDGPGKLAYLLYSPEAKTIEAVVIAKFRSRREYANHERLKNVTLDEIVKAVHDLLIILQVPYTEINLNPSVVPIFKFIEPKDETEFSDDESQWIQILPRKQVPKDYKETHRKCSRCCFAKPTKYFNIETGRCTGYSAQCKVCLKLKRENHKANLPTLDQDSQRICDQCGDTKKVRDFNQNKAYKDGYYPMCKVCLDEQQESRGVLGQTNEPAEYKTCAKCKENKVSSEFCKDRRRVDGLCNHCKICHNS